MRPTNRKQSTRCVHGGMGLVIAEDDDQGQMCQVPSQMLIPQSSKQEGLKTRTV